MAIQLNNAKKAGLFKMLVNTPLQKAGLEYGFDKHYKDIRAVKNAVYKIYNEVKNNPEEYFILPETVEMVTNAVSKRAITPQRVEASLAEKEMDKLDVKNMALSNRDKVASLIGKKLDSLNRSRKKLDSVSLPQLATTFGILFDKSQIIQGQATEHVAVLSRIEDGLSAEKLLEITLKQRESTIEGKE